MPCRAAGASAGESRRSSIEGPPSHSSGSPESAKHRRHHMPSEAAPAVAKSPDELITIAHLKYQESLQSSASTVALAFCPSAITHGPMNPPHLFPPLIRNRAESRPCLLLPVVATGKGRWLIRLFVCSPGSFLFPAKDHERPAGKGLLVCIGVLPSCENHQTKHRSTSMSAIRSIIIRG